MTQRRTKIVATIGPASDDPQVLKGMLAAGMDAARISLAHTPLPETLDRIARVRAAGEADGRLLAILADLPGPKIRAAEFIEGGAFVGEGSAVELVPAVSGDRSTGERIAVDYPTLLADLQPGDRLALGDGAVELLVDEVDPAVAARASVVTGGWVQGRPGVALPAGRLTISSPTDDDLRFCDALATADVDAVAISFVRAAADMERAREATAGWNPMLVAKIETQEAIDALDEIIAASDGVMVARGDLGIRCALEDVPIYQKRTIRTGVAYGRPMITATQMLESMVRAPTPTRAEVSDIANAVFDGTSAVMLSGETAIGHDPVAAVATMARVALRAEREFDYVGWGHNLGRLQVARNDTAANPSLPAAVRITAAVSAATWRAATDADVTAIIACTNSGSTARAISRYRPTVPILAMTPSLKAARQLCMAWGITPIVAEHRETTDDIVWFAVQRAAEMEVVHSGDLVAVLVGSPTDPEPVTDTLRLVRVH